MRPGADRIYRDPLFEETRINQWTWQLDTGSLVTWHVVLRRLRLPPLGGTGWARTFDRSYLRCAGQAADSTSELPLVSPGRDEVYKSTQRLASVLRDHGDEELSRFFEAFQSKVEAEPRCVFSWPTFFANLASLSVAAMAWRLRRQNEQNNNTAGPASEESEDEPLHDVSNSATSSDQRIARV